MEPLTNQSQQGQQRLPDPLPNTLADRYRGCLLGLACGDAVGTTVEFQSRGSFTPLDDMVGGGPFGLRAGQWTDDTSMALCLAASLVEQGRFDAKDQMERYVRWWREGYMSSTGHCFDIGVTTSAALSRYLSTGDPFAGSTSSRSAGNGSLMRLAPVPLFYYPDGQAAIRFAADSSRTTHGAAEAVDACRLFAAMLVAALAGAAKEELLFAAGAAFAAGSQTEPLQPAIAAIAAGDYRDKTAAQIQGSGYVVKSLEAALWCFWRTDDYRSAMLAAANLGDDADTTAAVCGQIAGAFYGAAAIPAEWRSRLHMAAEITALADALLARNNPEKPKQQS